MLQFAEIAPKNPKEYIIIFNSDPSLAYFSDLTQFSSYPGLTQFSNHPSFTSSVVTPLFFGISTWQAFIAAHSQLYADCLRRIARNTSECCFFFSISAFLNKKQVNMVLV